MALDASGNLYIADTLNYRVRKVSPPGIITTLAGNGLPGYSGDGGFAASAQLNLGIVSEDLLSGVAVDASGDVYVADSGNNAIRLLQPVLPGRHSLRR